MPKSDKDMMVEIAAGYHALKAGNQTRDTQIAALKSSLATAQGAGATIDPDLEAAIKGLDDEVVADSSVTAAADQSAAVASPDTVPQPPAGS
jgi:hypothetical protein